MQYELIILCRRTPGLESLAEWQYTRYASAALEVFQAAADQEPGPLDLDMTDLANFLVAAMDGLVLQYEVTHDTERCERDLQQHHPSRDVARRPRNHLREPAPARPGPTTRP